MRIFLFRILFAPTALDSCMSLVDLLPLWKRFADSHLPYIYTVEQPLSLASVYINFLKKHSPHFWQAGHKTISQLKTTDTLLMCTVKPFGPSFNGWK